MENKEYKHMTKDKLIEYDHLIDNDLDDSTLKVKLNLNDEEDIEIDLYIYKLIHKLNKLGYTTAFCCSGHEEDLFCCWYITFDYDLPKYKVEKLKRNLKAIENLIFETNIHAEAYTNGCYCTFIDMINPTTSEKNMVKKLINMRSTDPDNYPPILKERFTLRIDAFNYDPEYVYYKDNNIIDPDKLHNILIENKYKMMKLTDQIIRKI